MKTTIDDKGLVHIPAEVCALAGLMPGSEIEVTVEDRSIRLAPAKDSASKGRPTLRGRPAKTEEELAEINRPYESEKDI